MAAPVVQPIYGTCFWADCCPLRPSAGRNGSALVGEGTFAQGEMASIATFLRWLDRQAEINRDVFPAAITKRASAALHKLFK